MNDLTRNHPAVEAAHKATRRAYGSQGADALNYHATALRAAIPHLTADDLIGHPAVRELMAEGWDRGAADNERAWTHVYDGHDVDPDDPLAECQTCCTTNPYREEAPNE